MKGKRLILKAALERFIKSEQHAGDFLELFVAVHITLRQGDGLIWKEVEECINEALLLKETNDEQTI